MSGFLLCKSCYTNNLSSLRQNTISICRILGIRSCSGASNPETKSSSRGANAVKSGDCNWVRAPHPVSNLRLIEYGFAPNPTEADKQLRLKRIQVQEWNHEFWTKHNSKYSKARRAFIDERKKALNKKTVLSADEMSQFYKKFLDENYPEHINYNRVWYEKNISLLFASIKAYVYRFLKIFKD